LKDKPKKVDWDRHLEEYHTPWSGLFNKKEEEQSNMEKHFVFLGLKNEESKKEEKDKKIRV